MKSVLTTLFLLIAFSPAFSQTDRVTGWKNDITFLEKELPSKHIDLFAKRSRDLFRADLKAIAAQTDSLSDLAISLKLQQVIVRFGDAHTAAYYRKFIDSTKIYPLNLFWFKDGIYPIITTAENEKLLGKRIVSFNGKPIQIVIDSLTTLLTVDNFSCIKKEIPRLMVYSEVLEFFGFMNENGLVVDAVDPGSGITISHKVVFNTSNAPTIELKRDSVPFNNQNGSLLFTDKYFEQDSIYRIQYNRCWSRELQQRYNPGKSADKYPSFLDFHNRIIHTISEKPVQKIVFDLRFNSGGSSPQGSSLIDAMSKTDRVKNGARVYVLIGRYTYSSAVINAMDFKKFPNVIYVGEEASGKPNHFGEVRTFTLPNSGMIISYSTKFFKRVEDDNQSLQPDVEILSTIQDYLHGFEPAYEWIRNDK